jgi:sugar phosphate isomerase/epimerase
MILGYNTNGLNEDGNLSSPVSGSHDPVSTAALQHFGVRAVELLAEIGYRGIAITIDSHLLNPLGHDLAGEILATTASMQEHRFRSVIETGARFLLDPDVKHEPTLVSSDPAGRAKRIDFLCRAIDIASALGSDCVSLWSGAVRDGAGDRQAMDRLVSGLVEVIDYAGRRGVTLAFEPEPGMLIDSMARYADLLAELSTRRVDLERFRLTIDIGHLHCQGELPITDQLRRWADRLVNVHIEDMRAGVHEHLMFGEGEINFPPVISALAEISYDGLVGVELSRHSHEGPAAARKAFEFLRPLC